MRHAYLFAIAGIAILAHAQSPVSFEAASVRRNLSGEMNTHISVSGNRLTVENASLKTLIRNSWDLLSFQFSGGPGWIDTEMFDIVATAGDSGKIEPERLRLLLQSLLADRFALKVHWENRETNVYALVVAKDGPKLKEGSAGQEPGINTSKFPGNGRMKGTNEPISILTTNLGNQLGRFVIDKTGLQGRWDWLLEWDPDPTADSTRPSLFTAVQQQLGLKLEPQKGPMPVLVIDSAQHPSDN